MPQLINPTVWAVFAINLTYDDSYYELHEYGILKHICGTEEQANIKLKEVQAYYLELYSECSIEGYNRSSTKSLIKEYCCIKPFELL